MTNLINLVVGQKYVTRSGAMVTVTKATKHDTFLVADAASGLPVSAIYTKNGRVQFDTAPKNNPLTIVESADDRRIRYFCQFPDGRLYGPACSPVSWAGREAAVRANGERMLKGRARLIAFVEGYQG